MEAARDKLASNSLPYGFGCTSSITGGGFCVGRSTSDRNRISCLHRPRSPGIRLVSNKQKAALLGGPSIDQPATLCRQYDPHAKRNTIAVHRPFVGGSSSEPSTLASPSSIRYPGTNGSWSRCDAAPWGDLGCAWTCDQGRFRAGERRLAATAKVRPRLHPWSAGLPSARVETVTGIVRSKARFGG